MSRVVSRTIEVCVFKRSPEGPLYLLLKRSDDETLYPGMWQLITGSMHDAEPATTAALREFAEETGLTPAQAWVLPFVNTFFVPSTDTVHASPCFAVEVGEDATPKLSHEHQLFEWCILEEACNRLVWPGQKEEIRIVNDYIVGGREASRLLKLSL